MKSLNCKSIIDLIDEKQLINEGFVGNKDSAKEWWTGIHFLSELIYSLFKMDCVSYLPWKKPMFLYINTLWKKEEKHRFNPYAIIGTKEELICIMPATECSFYGLSNNERAYILFSNCALYIWVRNDDYVKRIGYGEINNIHSMGDYLSVTLRDGRNDKIPCDKQWNRAVRRFVLIVTDIRNNKTLYNFKMDSLGGKTISSMLVGC